MTKACEIMNISPQYYYKSLEHERAYYSDVQIIEEGLIELRQQHPNLGLKKFYQGYFDPIRAQLKGHWGQHKVLDLGKRKGWILKKKRSFTKTTDSYHHYKVHKNLIKDKADIKAGEVLVSDITYLRAGLKFVYLFLITDLASRKIVGWNLSNSLAADGAVSALKMARKNLSKTKDVIHHSDRGIQYCCGRYMEAINSYKMRLSMTEENHCYENAVAERVNGILKNEYNLGEILPSNISLIGKIVSDTVSKYNSQRKHWSLDLQTPDEVFYQQQK